MNILTNKLKEVTMSVAPVTLIVLILHLTIAPIDSILIARFLVGAVFIIFGLGIFLFGVEISIQQMGALMGSSLTKTRSIWILIVLGFILGFFVNIAEPDLQVLARQVNEVTSGQLSQGTILVVVSIGIGLLVAVGLLRIVFHIPLNKLLTGLYGLIFILSIFAPEDFLGIAFDSGGATTGSMTVPFILSLGLGLASLQGGRDAEEGSFGLVGIASAGPMIAVLSMSIISGIKKLNGNLPSNSMAVNGIISPFIRAIPGFSLEVIISLLPLLILFFIFNKLFFSISKRQLKRILKGLLYTFLGFVLFLTGVNAGFMEAGRAIGFATASLEQNWVIVPIGFVLGCTVILAEPAVYVLNEQIENVTSGHIRKKFILFTLSLGVAIAVALSMLKILVPNIKLWHYLLPGYLIAIILSCFSPKIFTGIAFDSGGVASGPMTATFILAFAQGVANAIESANVILDAFGVISMVALTPLIAIQILGLIYERKATKEELSK